MLGSPAFFKITDRLPFFLHHPGQRPRVLPAFFINQNLFFQVPAHVGIGVAALLALVLNGVVENGIEGRVSLVELGRAACFDQPLEFPVVGQQQLAVGR